MRVFRFGGKMGEGSAASSSSSEAVTKSRDVHASSRDASSGDDGSSRERLEVRRAALTRDIPAEPRPERPPDPPKTRRQLGLDFLRRDVSHAVRRAATVEPVGVGAPLSEARASDAVARCSTRRITAYVTSDPAPSRSAAPSIPPAAVARRSHPRESYGGRLAEGVRATKARVAETLRKRAEERSERLPEPCDYQRAVWLGVQDKIKVANACARHLGLVTRYRSVTRPPRGIHVEAYPVSRDGDGDGDGEDEGARTVSRRRMTVDAFLNSEARLWAQANHLETNVQRASRPAFRDARRTSDAEASGASTHASGCRV